MLCAFGVAGDPMWKCGTFYCPPESRLSKNFQFVSPGIRETLGFLSQKES